MPGNSHSTGIRALAILTAVVTAGTGFSVFAEDPPKKADEPWTAPSRAARKENPIPAEANSIAKGKELFVMACLPCHGAAGKGDGPAAGTLERNGVHIRPGNLSDPKMREQSDGALFWKISEGKSPMPTFLEALKEEQRWQIVNYVRTLAAPVANRNQETNSGGKK